jgi:hypothetical protein
MLMKLTSEYVQKIPTYMGCINIELKEMNENGPKKMAGFSSVVNSRECEKV